MNNEMRSNGTSGDSSSQGKNDSELTPGNVQARSWDARVQWIFQTLARFFNGFHWAVGMTALPDTASPREVRSFVFMWLGIIVFMIVFFALMIRLL